MITIYKTNRNAEHINLPTFSLINKCNHDYYFLLCVRNCYSWCNCNLFHYVWCLCHCLNLSLCKWPKEKCFADMQKIFELWNFIFKKKPVHILWIREPRARASVFMMYWWIVTKANPLFLENKTQCVPLFLKSLFPISYQCSLTYMYMFWK